MSEEVKDKPEAAPAETPRDWVGEAVKCFITDAQGIDPTDPISAIAEYFAKNATDELKAKRKAEEKAEREWIAKTMKVRFEEIEAFQKSLKRTDILKGCGYTLVLAKTQKELRAEGRRMGNCVGNGTYGRGIVEGDRLIVMLGLGGKSYCDIEIDRRNWRVNQCLKGNTTPPEEVRELANKIALVLKAEHRRHRKGRRFV